MELRKRTEKSTSYKEDTEEGGYDSDSSASSEDLPSLPFLLSSVRTKQKCRKSIQELLEEHQSLAEDIKDHNISQNNVEEKMKQLEIEHHQDVEQMQTSTPEVVTEKDFYVFCVNDSLQFFNSREVTPSQCGYNNLSSDLTVSEDELLGCIRVELEHVLSSYLLTCHPCCISDLKSFVTYLLKNLISSDAAAINASYFMLRSVLSKHPGAKTLPFNSAEIFMLLFNFGIDVDSCELLMKCPTIKQQVKITRLPINLYKAQNRLPDKWTFNLTVIMNAVIALLANCNIKVKDVCDILLFFIWMSLDFTIVQENLLPNVQSCIRACLDRLKGENWSIVLVDVARLLVSIEFSSENEKWKYLYLMAEAVPPLNKAGIYLRKQISFLALKHLCFGNAQELEGGSSDIEFKLLGLINLFQKFIQLDSDALSAAVKFIDLCLSHLNSEEENYSELCNFLKKCESAVSDCDEKAYAIKGHFVKIQAKLRILGGKDSMIKVSAWDEDNICDKIKKEVDSQILLDNHTFSLNNVKMENINKSSENTELIISENPSSTIVNSNFDSIIHSDLVTNNTFNSPNEISVESLFSVENSSIDSSLVCTEVSVPSNGPVIKHVESMFVESEACVDRSLVIDGLADSHVGIADKTEVPMTCNDPIIVKFDYDSKLIENACSSGTHMNSDLIISSDPSVYNLLNSHEAIDSEVNLSSENYVLVDASDVSKSNCMVDNKEFTVRNSDDNASGNTSNNGILADQSVAEESISKSDSTYNLAPIVVDSISFDTEETEHSELECNLPSVVESYIDKSSFGNGGFDSYASESQIDSIPPSDLTELNNHLNVNEPLSIDNCQNSSAVEPDLELTPPYILPDVTNSVISNNLFFNDNSQCVSANLESDMIKDVSTNEDVVFIKEVASQKKTGTSKNMPENAQTEEDKVTDKDPQIIFLKKVSSPFKPESRVSTASKDLSKSSNSSHCTTIQIKEREEDVVFVKEVQSPYKKRSKSKSVGHSSSSPSNTSSSDPYLHNLSLNKGITLIQPNGSSPNITSPNIKEISDNSGTLNVHFDRISKDDIMLLEKVGTTRSNQHKSSSDRFTGSGKTETIVLDLPLKKRIDFENLKDVSLLINATSGSKSQFPTNEKENKSMVVEIEAIDCDQITSGTVDENVKGVTDDESDSVEDLSNADSQVSSVIDELLMNVNHILDTEEEAKQKNISLNQDVCTLENSIPDKTKDISSDPINISYDKKNEMMKMSRDMNKNVNKLKPEAESEDFTKKRPLTGLTDKVLKSAVVNPEVVSLLKCLIESLTGSQPHSSCNIPEASKTVVLDSFSCNIPDSAIVSTVSSMIDNVDKSLSSDFSFCSHICGTSVESDTKLSVISKADDSEQSTKESEIKKPTIIRLNLPNVEGGVNYSLPVFSKRKFSGESNTVKKVLKSSTTNNRENKHVEKKCESTEKLPFKMKLCPSNSLCNPWKGKDSSGSCTIINSTKRNILPKVVDSKVQRLQKRKNIESAGPSSKSLKLVSDPKKCEAVNAPLVNYLKSVNSTSKQHMTYSPTKCYLYGQKNFFRKKNYSFNKPSPKNLLKYSSKKPLKPSSKRCLFDKYKKTSPDKSKKSASFSNGLSKNISSSSGQSAKPTNSNSDLCVSISSDSDVEELYCDPKRYADLECMIIYESIEQIVLD